MIFLWAIALLTTIVVIGYSIRVAMFARLCPRLIPSNALPQSAPLISIVVPARNEADNIERCIRSLLAQSYPHLEVIAIDDGSIDTTPQILARLAAEDERLHVVAGAPLPQGWLGKPHAVHQGVQQAQGSWLLFVDADVLLHPNALSCAYQVAIDQKVVMLSLWARQELVTFWERIVQPVIICLNHSLDPFQHVNDPSRPDATSANGQFILAERTAYERIGGHAAVRNEVVEDQKLSLYFKRAGERILMMDGTRVLSARMYTSLRGIWEGWSKNNFLMLGRSYPMMLLGVLATYVIVISSWVLLISGLLLREYLLASVGLLLIMMLMAARWLVRSYFTATLRDYLLHALGGLVFIGIILNSAYQHTWGRGVPWKGRRYGEVDTAL